MKQITLIATMLAAAFISSGCKTTSVGEMVTPARIEAVTALGAYYGGLAAVKNGHQVKLERALAGLKVLQASGSADIPAIVNAISGAGITFFDSSEGQLALGAVVVFADGWSGTVQPVLDGAHARAVLTGAIRGFQLALGTTNRSFPEVGDPTGVKLLLDATKTRPVK